LTATAHTPIFACSIFPKPLSIDSKVALHFSFYFHLALILYSKDLAVATELLLHFFSIILTLFSYLSVPESTILLFHCLLDWSRADSDFIPELFSIKALCYKDFSYLS